MQESAHALVQPLPAAFALWLALTVLGCIVLARVELQRLREAFDTDARIVHRTCRQGGQ